MEKDKKINKVNTACATSIWIMQQFVHSREKCKNIHGTSM